MHFDPKVVRSVFLADSAAYLGLRDADVNVVRHGTRAQHGPHAFWPMPYRAGAPDLIVLAVDYQRSVDRRSTS